MPNTLYMVVERFKNKDAVAVYRRFRERGRMAPDGLVYVSSWVDDRFERCYKVMETHDRRLLDEWMENWGDHIDFDVHVVLPSREAAEKIAARSWARTGSLLVITRGNTTPPSVRPMFGSHE